MAEKTYAWNAEDYARFSSEQYRWAQELIGKLTLQPHETLVDLGCGDGKITAALASQLPRGRAVGIDRSWEMVALSRRQFPANRFPNLIFSQIDASALAFQSSFDAAFSNAALHWIKDHRPVLASVARALKPGGRLLFQMGGQGNAAGIIQTLDEVRNRPAWRGFFAGFEFPYGFYGIEEYEGLLRRSGLQARRIDLIPKDMQHAGREGLAGWIRTTWLPYTARVPAEQREDFIAETVERYTQRQPADSSGQVHVQMMRLEVEAVR